jgi:hypothetical protein
LCAIYALKLIITSQVTVIQFFAFVYFMPVTQGVAGSSPVQTASEAPVLLGLLLFCTRNIQSFVVAGGQILQNTVKQHFK